MGSLSGLRDHPLAVAVLICSRSVGTTWIVADKICVEPRDLIIQEQDADISELQADASRLESSIQSLEAELSRKTRQLKESDARMSLSDILFFERVEIDKKDGGEIETCIESDCFRALRRFVVPSLGLARGV